MHKIENERKHLVIVGGSFAGLMLLDQVKDKFNITLIDKKDHFEWILSLPVMLMDPEMLKNSESVMFDEMVARNKVFGDRVQYVQGMLVSLVDNQTLKIKRTDHIEDGKDFEEIPDEIINYDYLALCTGSHFRINDSNDERVTHLFNRDDRIKFYDEYYEKIEVLGEIQAKYKHISRCEI